MFIEVRTIFHNSVFMLFHPAYRLLRGFSPLSGLFSKYTVYFLWKRRHSDLTYAPINVNPVGGGGGGARGGDLPNFKIFWSNSPGWETKGQSDCFMLQSGKIKCLELLRYPPIQNLLNIHWEIIPSSTWSAASWYFLHIGLEGISSVQAKSLSW